MNRPVRIGVLAGLALGACSSAWAAPTLVEDAQRGMTLTVFAAFILATLLITYWAARRNASAREFYTAGGGISGLQNGLAIAGDYLSAAAFLGVSGLIALYGFDGILYLVGFFVGFIPVLLLIAEPCRNLGRYTLGDVLAYRNDFRSAKSAGALSSVCVAICYLIPQIVGGGVIVQALIGIRYEVAVVIVGVLMMIYVFFGGMRATTWVQLIKAVLLLLSCLLLVILAWAPYGFSLPGLLGALVEHPEVRAYAAGLTTPPGDAAAAATRLLEPGLYLKNPLEQLSLGLALVLGTAAMPHVLMRFFTVRDAGTARQSVLYAMLFIGICHLMIVLIGFAAALYIGAPTIRSFDPGGNLAAPLLAQYLGGGADSLLGNLLLAFIAAVSFTTIVAVVAGLTLASASALAHDVYVGAIKGGSASEREQVIAARLATLLVGAVALVVGILAKGQNVAHLVGLAYAVAASANLPALLLTLYWRRCSSIGVLAGVLGGTAIAIALVLVSPNMSYPTGGTSLVGLEAPLISLRNPGVISIPLGFALVVVFSLLCPDRLSQTRWAELAVRRDTGQGVAQAVGH
ncbi:solute symporter family protein [Halotalea alkalilenta]|uniref:Cation acetate symporter n=1 Tax=Halotalea alkalilenta TaxID=376489 RepID=A0A172YI43_9GAMM|nr:cation acetate symporter [Halotalea alkalilenta]ANF58856.1 cation acetate symporter [Halotalea alkalilenta]